MMIVAITTAATSAEIAAATTTATTTATTAHSIALPITFVLCHLDLYRATLEFLAVKPINGRTRGILIVVCDGCFSLGFPGILVFVHPNFRFTGALVVLQSCKILINNQRSERIDYR
jgi:hypothetical protein